MLYTLRDWISRSRPISSKESMPSRSGLASAFTRVFLPMSVLRSSLPAHVDAALPAPRIRFSPGGWQVPNMSLMCRERAAAASKGPSDSKRHFAQQMFQGKVWKEYDCTEALSRCGRCR